jgi:hypothetical protein
MRLPVLLRMAILTFSSTTNFCRRVHRIVLVTLQQKRRESGESSLRNMDFGAVYPHDLCTDQDVRMAALVFIPVFSGPQEAGHWWATRTEYEHGGIVVYFDSLRTRLLSYDV